METQRAQRLCEQFDLGSFRSVQTAGGTRNINYVLVTESGKWFVRQRYAAYSAEERLRFDHAAIRYQAERGVPVNPPRPTAEGATWWTAFDAVWEVFPFVEGRHLRDGDRTDAAALGTALAQWHQAGHDFPLRYEKGAPRGEADPLRLLTRAAEMAQDSSDMTDALEPYRNALEWAAEASPAAQYAALPHTLIHGDIQPANLLVVEESKEGNAEKTARIAAFVDMDWCAWQARLYDLCFAILVSCASHATPIDGGDIRSLTQTPFLQESVNAAFLNAYEAASTPLTEAERAVLLPELTLAWCHVRVDGAFKVPQEERAAFLRRPPDMMNLDWLALPSLPSHSLY